MSPLFGINPRNAFIGMCFMMAGADQEFDERELNKIDEVLTRYGFSDEEIDKELNRISKMNSTRQGMRWGAKVMMAILKLDEEMRKNLVQALTNIAEADEYFHDAEKMLLMAVKQTFGMPA